MLDKFFLASGPDGRPDYGAFFAIIRAKSIDHARSHARQYLLAMNRKDLIKMVNVEDLDILPEESVIYSNVERREVRRIHV